MRVPVKGEIVNSTSKGSFSLSENLGFVWRKQGPEQGVSHSLDTSRDRGSSTSLGSPWHTGAEGIRGIARFGCCVTQWSSSSCWSRIFLCHSKSNDVHHLAEEGVSDFHVATVFLPGIFHFPWGMLLSLCLHPSVHTFYSCLVCLEVRINALLYMQVQFSGFSLHFIYEKNSWKCEHTLLASTSSRLALAIS